jgi:hypothetical protein
VFRTFTHNFGNNYRIFRAILGTMLRDSVFKTSITVEPVETKDSHAHAIFIVLMEPCKFGKPERLCQMAKTVNTPQDSHTMDSVTFSAVTIAAVIS